MKNRVLKVCTSAHRKGNADYLQLKLYDDMVKSSVVYM